MARVAKVVRPEQVAAYMTALGDAGFDYVEGVRSGEDPIRAAAGVVGSTVGGLGAFELTSRLLRKNKSPLLKAAAPVAAGFVAAVPGGYFADRIDEKLRPLNNYDISQEFNNNGDVAIGGIGSGAVSGNSYIWVTPDVLRATNDFFGY